MIDSSVFPYLTLDIPKGFAHIYLNRHSDDILQHLLYLLQEKELERANKFTNATGRNTYIKAHVFLRQVLSRYIAVPPEDIFFEYTTWGQPVITGLQQPFYFNLSYRKAMGIVGISDHPIGLDIEHIQLVDINALAQNFFSLKEQSILHSINGSNEKLALFFRIWTLKEAFIKGLGLGLNYDLQSFSILLQGEGIDPVLDCNEKGWLLKNINVQDEYVASVAVNVGII